MSQKQVLKPIINFILVAALSASLSSVAFAAPPLQTGGNQGSDSGQNSGNDQENNGNQDNNNQETGTNQGGMETNQGAGMNQNNAALACSQTYVVQQGDSLSLIASRFYNDVTAYDTIVQGTNAQVGTGANFTNISDPNLIMPGQTLCIPAAPGSAAANANTGGAMGTGGTTQGAMPAAASGSGNMGVQPAAATMVGSRQGMLIVENLSGTDLIFDLTQPSLGSAWVGPNQQARFTLQPGQQQFSAHHPAGDFGVAPGTVQITSGQVIWLACSQNMCQMVPSSQLQQGQQQMGGQQQQGQMQQPTQQQQQQGQQNNNGDNNNNNNSGDNNNNNNSGDNNNNDNNGGSSGGGNQ